MVDVRECDAEDTGEADGDEIGEVVVEWTDGTDDNGGSLNIWNEARDAKPTRHSSWHAICLLCQHVIMERTLLWHDECRNEEEEEMRLHVSFRRRKKEREKQQNQLSTLALSSYVGVCLRIKFPPRARACSGDEENKSTPEQSK